MANNFALAVVIVLNPTSYSGATLVPYLRSAPRPYARYEKTMAAADHESPRFFMLTNNPFVIWIIINNPLVIHL